MSTCLWTFGKYLERVLLVPTLAVPAVYMVSGVAGGLASANLAVDRVTVTCTAAICGLIGGGSLCVHLQCTTSLHTPGCSADLLVGACFIANLVTCCTGSIL